MNDILSQSIADQITATLSHEFAGQWMTGDTQRAIERRVKELYVEIAADRGLDITLPHFEIEHHPDQTVIVKVFPL